MTRLIITALLLASIAAAAQAPSTNLGYTDTPILPGLSYHVHDPVRPRPAIVTPAPRIGDAPSDATVLFNGTDLSAWTPTKNAWRVENGYIEVVPNSGDPVQVGKGQSSQPLSDELEVPRFHLHRWIPDAHRHQPSIRCRFARFGGRRSRPEGATLIEQSNDAIPHAARTRSKVSPQTRDLRLGRH